MASNDISVSLKTNNLKDKDENLVLNFEGGSVISTGGNIKITQDGKTIEEIAIGGGKTSGGVYHSNSMVWDYEYNQIALANDDIFKHLANHNNKKISDKTEEEWTTELRNDWKIAINGGLYSLAKRDQDLSSDDYYNYHETDPEYTPGVDKSGNGDVVLTPSSGIEQLIIDPSNLEDGGSYLIDLSDAGLISASDNSKDLLPAPLEINVGTSLTPTPSPAPTPTPTPPNEISELTADQLSKFSAKAVSALSAKQVKNLSADAVSEISPKAVKGFTAEQMENLPIGAFMALKKRQLAKLNPDAVTGLTEQHLKTLTDDEISAFKPTQIKVISPDAISGFKPSVLNTLNKGQIEALTDD